MEAKEGYGGSYAWKSILKGREVIRRGSKWRVGNGESINLWGDKWLPSLQNPSLQSPLTADLQNAKVSHLIDPMTRQWDTPLLHNCFSHVEADLITQIPLGRTTSQDSLFWPFVQDGHYSTKSGYYFLKTEAKMTTSQPTAHAELMKPLWKKIWSLSVPCKVRNFLWRACKNAIPTLKNLNRRCVVDDSRCSLCSQQEEDVLHALWSCPSLAQVWNEDSQWHFRDQTDFQEFSHLLLYVFDSGGSAEMFAMMIWTIWHRRNKARTNPPGLPLNLIVQRAYEALMEFRSAQPKKSAATPTVGPSTRWSPPPVGWYKANFDAVIFQNNGRAGIGVIVRNNQGLSMVSLAQNIQLASSVAEVEALAATRALELAAELGFDQIIFEGDSTLVISGLSEQVQNLTPFGLLIKEAQDLASCFNHIQFQHVRREGNSVAHNLARHACHVTGFSVWMEDVPSQCLEMYQADLPSS